ncbi:MAG: hypothetical protein II879_01090 [Clostridia bacterium]|nr:hypothetical protein [Clostridia bacterium]
MKKQFCLRLSLFLAVLLLLNTAVPAVLAEEDELLLMFKYPVNEQGEAAVNDVSFDEGWGVDDQHRVFYEIFVGSFSDSDGDGIGDLRGIINRMDYLNDGDPQSGLSLGVEGIWLTPIFASPSYHKYDVTDYYTVDPQFGTNEDFRELAQLCHERGVRVILDMPINHTGSKNRWFRNFLNAHLMNSPDNIWYDFYTWLGADDAVPAGRHFARASGQNLRYEANFSDDMPELNFDNPRVYDTVLDVARHWLDMGADGFRFDAAKYLYLNDHARNLEFWTRYLNDLRAIKPDLYTVAEVWDGEGITDMYLPAINCFNFATSQTSGLIAETAHAGDANRYAAYLERTLGRIHTINPDAMNIPFIANHDTDRAAGYLTTASGQMQVAANLYLLSPGSPFIYYGEEIGLRGSRGGANTDANRRLAMVWGDGDTIQDPPGSTYNKQTDFTVQKQKSRSDSPLTYYKRLIMIRKAHPEIARGELTALSFSDTKAGGYLCTWQGRSVAVLHNTTQSTAKLILPENMKVRMCEWIGMGEASLDGDTVTLDGQTSVILQVE